MCSETLFVVPAWNEERGLATLLPKTLAMGPILVVDDGSVDNTGTVATGFSNVQVLSKPVNEGYELALVDGLNWAKAQGFKYAITMDADGQHRIEDVLKVAALVPTYQVVFTRRQQYQRFAEMVAGTFYRFRFGLSDPFSGLKGYQLHKLEESVIHALQDSGGIGASVTLIKGGASFTEIDINTEPRIDTPRYLSGSEIRANARLLVAAFKALVL
jgi:glycosyltransferase involved in cell wall biosynthesis